MGLNAAGAGDAGPTSGESWIDEPDLWQDGDVFLVALAANLMSKGRRLRVPSPDRSTSKG